MHKVQSKKDLRDALNSSRVHKKVKTVITRQRGGLNRKWMEDRGGKESFHSFFHTFGFLNNTNISSTKKKKKKELQNFTE